MDAFTTAIITGLTGGISVGIMAYSAWFGFRLAMWALGHLLGERA